MESRADPILPANECEYPQRDSNPGYRLERAPRGGRLTCGNGLAGR